MVVLYQIEGGLSNGSGKKEIYGHHRASSGIGYETAKAFSGRGKNLIIVARRKDNLEMLKKEILEERPDVDVVIRSTDLSVPENAYQFYEGLKDYGVETWVNNAGFGNYDSVADQDLGKIGAMLHLNIEALTILSSLFVRDYKEIDGTQLINVLSCGGHNCCSPLSAKLKCGDCGEYFGSKVWHSNSKYKRTIWQCNAKFKGGSRCATPHLYEQQIKEMFLEALGILIENREEIIGDCRAVMEALAECGSIDAEMEAVSDEMEVTAGLIQKLVDENATRKLDQHDYRKKYDGYASRYAALESRLESLEKERERKEIQYDIFSGFLAGLSETEELTVDFNGKLFHRLVDYATVYPDGRVVFAFRNGVEISTKI